VFGHENMGIVDKVGEGVDTLAPGDRVSIPFNVATGYSKNVERG
jgi:threonine dehydrogenase-like Zn-dependent dehydrogenase